MVSLDQGNVYITSGTVSGDTITGGITVRIDQQKIDTTLNNELIEFNVPVAPGSSSDTAPSSQLIDLKKIKCVLAIQGVLVTDSDSDAFTKKRDLMVLAGYGSASEYSTMASQTIKSGNVTVVWGLDAQSSQEKVTGNIVKIMVTETPGKMSDGTATDTKKPVQYSVQIGVAVGTER
ncbi:MAG: hypothetical protein ACTSX6_04845 [Candidatus Heimdallarchaeaceae archaeon]